MIQFFAINKQNCCNATSTTSVTVTATTEKRSREVH